MACHTSAFGGGEDLLPSPRKKSPAADAYCYRRLAGPDHHSDARVGSGAGVFNARFATAGKQVTATCDSFRVNSLTNV
jgi:protein involved in ribonucleotide reduction